MNPIPVREYSSVEKKHAITLRIPLGMRPTIKGCIPNGMQVPCMDTFSTERYSLTGINNTLMFEEQLKYDLYSCRKGRGTHFGIQRMAGFLRQCSENYTKDCYATFWKR